MSPPERLREAIALAIDLGVHLARVDGRRVVTDVIAVHDYDARADRFHVETLYRAARPQREGANG